MVVLPVFLQAPWVHKYPISVCLFTFVWLGIGIGLATLGGGKWFDFGSLLIGVSGSWLGGCLFWGWLRAYPLMHLPVEAVALPTALYALSTRWRLGAGFYIACLVGTGCTDLMMVLTGVMNLWPDVVQASLQDAPVLLQSAAEALFNLQSIILLIIAAILIILLANFMKQRVRPNSPTSSTWLVASAALTTTVWIDGLFLMTALFAPRLSGLI